MEINLNNNKEQFDYSELSITEILEIKNFSFRMLIIKVNGKLIPKASYDTKLVKNGDKVDIIHLMSGG